MSGITEALSRIHRWELLAEAAERGVGRRVRRPRPSRHAGSEVPVR